jgi:hypothetical protein
MSVLTKSGRMPYGGEHPAASSFLVLFSAGNSVADDLVVDNAVRIHPDAAVPSAGKSARAIQTFHP